MLPLSSAASTHFWVSANDHLFEYDTEGTQLRDVLAQGPAPTRSTEVLRHAVEDVDGKVWLFNGTFTPEISCFDPVAVTWTQYAAGVFATYNNYFNGDFAIYGQYCFTSDHQINGHSTKGFVRYDRLTGNIARVEKFEDLVNLTIGHDGLLYTLGYLNNNIDVYDPRSLKVLRSFRLETPDHTNALRVLADGTALAVSAEGNLIKFASDGAVVASIRLQDPDRTPPDYNPEPGCLDVLVDGRVAVGTRIGRIFIVASDLSSCTYFYGPPVNRPGIVAARPSLVGPVLIEDPAPSEFVAGAMADKNVTVYFKSPRGAGMRYTATGLPPGISIDAVSGHIQGVPLQVGTFTATVTATETDIVPRSVTTSMLLVVKASTARLINISTRAFCGVGDRVAIAGVVLAGEGTKRLLVRAVGPTLAQFGLTSSELLQKPQLAAFRGQALLMSNDGWPKANGAAELKSVFEKVGASAFAADDTNSCALLFDATAGAYTFVVSGIDNATGIVLLEVYDTEPSNGTMRIVDLAARVYSGPGNGVAIGGFVITGNPQLSVLIRGVGPTLTSLGLQSQNVLMDPAIELHRGAPIIQENDNWGSNANAPEITSVGHRIGANPFDPGDVNSAALLLSTEAGAYTFLAKGKNGGAGVVLVEVYDAQ